MRVFMAWINAVGIESSKLNILTSMVFSSRVSLDPVIFLGSPMLVVSLYMHREESYAQQIVKRD